MAFPCITLKSRQLCFLLRLCPSVPQDANYISLMKRNLHFPLNPLRTPLNVYKQICLFWHHTRKSPVVWTKTNHLVPSFFVLRDKSSVSLESCCGKHGFLMLLEETFKNHYYGFPKLPTSLPWNFENMFLKDT